MQRRVFFSSRRRHTRYWRDWSSDVCSSDLPLDLAADLPRVDVVACAQGPDDALLRAAVAAGAARSVARRVGTECTSPRSPYHYKNTLISSRISNLLSRPDETVLTSSFQVIS